MVSIRSYLATRLLVGFVAVIGFGSILVYFISAKILETDFDSRLFAKAQAVIASTSQKGTRLDLDWSNLPKEIDQHGHHAEWVEVFDNSGHLVEGENFLDGNVGKGPQEVSYGNACSLTGKKLRIVRLTFTPSVEEEDLRATPPELRKPCLLIVGNKREQLDHSLRLIAIVLLGLVLVASGLSLGIVMFVLRRGLRPLVSLSQDVDQITELTLDRRIDLHSLPAEVLPVADKLNDLLDRLEISFGRERRFSADLSHELRTPVAELKTLSEVMLQQTDLPEEARQGFEGALAVARQMESLVTTLLEMVRQEEGRCSLRLSDVDLEPFIKKAWKKFEAAAKEREIQLKTIPPRETVILKTDPRLLTMALGNLFDNAVEYSPSGGVVNVEICETTDVTWLIISNSTENLAPTDLPHIFERFWRKDKARSESSHFGIGLALTRAVCQRIGIQLTASMEKGNLVRFWMRLPMKRSMREN